MKLLQNKKIAYLTAIFCTLLWGTAFPFIKVGYSAFKIEESDIGSKLIFAGMRFMLAGFMVFLFLWISKRKPPTLSKKDILPVCSLGVVQTGLQYIFTYIGIGFTSGTNTSIITACASFFTVLFVPLFFKNDRLTLMKIIGCILGFGGIIAINFGGTVSTDTWFGDMMILFSTISAAAGNIVAKKVTTGRDPFPVTAFQLLTGGFILLVSGICCGGRLTLMKIIGCILGFGGIIAINFGGTVSTDTWFGDMMILFSTISAAAGNIVAKKVTTGRDPFPVTAFQLLTGGFILLVSGICCGGSIGLINVESVSVLLWLAFVSAAAFSLWTALLKFHDASRISVFNLLVPVFGTVLSGLMLGENVFRIETLISLILISLGIAFVNMNLKKSGGKI